MEVAEFILNRVIYVAEEQKVEIILSKHIIVIWIFFGIIELLNTLYISTNNSN